MFKSRILTRLVNLAPVDIDLVMDFARQKGLGLGGFSASLRAILHEWSLLSPLIQSLPEPTKRLFSNYLEFANPSISREDELLESGTVEIEFPSAYTLDIPQDEYHAALSRARAYKFLEPPDGRENLT